MNNRPPYFILTSLLWLSGLVVFITLASWDTGLLTGVIENDRTHISSVLLITLFFANMHCIYRAYRLSCSERDLSAWEKGMKVHDQHLSSVLPLLSSDNNRYVSINGELLAEHFHYQHSFGWFTVGAMIKLGLLGTVIGFIIMLTSIIGLDSLEIEQVQHLMQQMAEGMMVALNTTLLGLVGSLILGVQYLFLDHSADQLLARAMIWQQQVSQEQKQGS